MFSFGSLLLLAAFVCFVLLAFGNTKASWLAIGLACWVAASLFGPLFLRGV